MTDIVERLHIAANSDWGQFVGDNLIRKAAARIEELEAELETLRGERGAAREIVAGELDAELKRRDSDGFDHVMSQGFEAAIYFIRDGITQP